MISLRRFLYIIPVLSLPVMLTIESGLVIYFCCATGNFILFNMICNTEFIKKIYNIPSSIDGSILEKMVNYLVII